MLPHVVRSFGVGGRTRARTRTRPRREACRLILRVILKIHLKRRDLWVGPEIEKLVKKEARKANRKERWNRRDRFKSSWCFTFNYLCFFKLSILDRQRLLKVVAFHLSEVLTAFNRRRSNQKLITGVVCLPEELRDRVPAPQKSDLGFTI